MIFDFADYRTYLKQVALDRRAKNPNYSFRAMAKQLNLAPSTLSEVIKGKKNLSLETATAIAHRLGLQNTEAEYFSLLVQLESAKDHEFKESLQRKLHTLNPKRSLHSLPIDVFKFIADWYHLAILTSMNMKSFEFTPIHISKTLGITKLEAETAVARLHRLELITKDKNDDFKRVKNDLFINSPAPDESLHRYHKQMLGKAADSIEGQPFNQRVVRTENIIIDLEQIPAAEALIEEFFEKMSRLTAKSKNKSKLYHLGTQFFSLMKSNGGKKP